MGSSNRREVLNRRGLPGFEWRGDPRTGFSEPCLRKSIQWDAFLTQIPEEPTKVVWTVGLFPWEVPMSPSVPSHPTISRRTMLRAGSLGLLDETLIVMCGEMGRTPKVNALNRSSGALPGRDHWGAVQTVFVAA